MLKQQAIIYSSILATLVSGTAAQAAFLNVSGKPPIDLQGEVNGHTFDYTIGPLDELLDGGVPTGEYRYDILDPFYVNLETGDVSTTEPVGVDNVRYNSFEAILDPRGAFGAVFTDHGDPSEFTQTFDFPEFDPTLFTSPTEPIFFGASIGGAISDINGLGVSLEPITTIQPKTLRATLFDVDDDEVATIDIGDALNEPGVGTGTFVYGPFNFPAADNPVFGVCADGCGRVELSLAFEGSGGGDIYVLTGTYDVFGSSTNPETVPEPSTVVSLISLSVLGLAFSRRKQG